MRLSHVLLVSGCALLAACGTKPIQPSDKHISQESVQGENKNPARNAGIPQQIKRTIPLSPPLATAKIATYSVVVTNVPAHEILFALARDAKINLDIHTGIQGSVTLNAIDQTLPQILNRIARQVDMRYELESANLIVMPDAPYLKHYKIDYVNMARDAEGSIANATQVGTGAAGGAAGTAGNNSSLSIKNTSKNNFWGTLTQNIKDILRETDKILPEGSSETVVQQSSAISTTGIGAQAAAARKQSSNASFESSPNPATLQEGGATVTRTSTFREAAAVIANPESGIITVRATGKQHERIQEFVDLVMTSARRQVLIEATIVEVRLSDNYQQGIDWSRMISASGTGFSLQQPGTTGVLPSANTGSMFLLKYANPASAFGKIAASVSLLESFGNVKVLSSPKLSVMNNQTAMLRVVDNLVYFTIKSDTTSNQTSTNTTYTTTANSVPVGFTMSVTPQINDSDVVLLNIRPSITRLLSYVNDPNPSLACPSGGASPCVAVVSRIPQTQTREMESVLKIENNQIAVMGGLMQDEINKLTDEVPWLARIPILGNLFQNRNDTTQKTELVIFLRPIVIKDASVNGDFSEFRDSLPGPDFFQFDAAGKSTSSDKP